MMHFLVLMSAMLAAAPAGPVKMDGAKLATTDVVSSGAVTVSDSSVALNGGRLTLSSAKQKVIDDTFTSKPTTILLSVVDNANSDGTVFSVGTLHLMEKDKGWYVVNNPGTEWHQVAAGIATKGLPLKLAIVSVDGTAHVYSGGKELGTMPFQPVGEQPLVIGSPEGEATPFKGEIRQFEIVSKPLKAEEIAMRMSPPATVPETAPTSSGGTTAPATTAPASSEETKTTEVQLQLVDLTAIPDPQSILPYKHALVVHEYKVLSVNSGHIKGVDAGGSIRVARWGIVGGKKTDVANAKKGDTVTLKLERFSDHPSLANQYTLDELPSNYKLPYVLDTTTAGAGG